MNSIETEVFDILHETQAIRTALMDILTDDDLAHKLPGNNPTLGRLCVDIGETQHSYIGSFETFTQDWSYRNTEPGLSESVELLKEWYAALDVELDATLSNLREEDIEARVIERGFQIPVRFQLHVYREALLIFYAKVMVYLNAMGKTPPQQMREWIG